MLRRVRPTGSWPVSRRTLLRGGVALAVAATGVGVGTSGVLSHRPRRDDDVGDSPYGPLSPVRDRATGLPLLRLPAGFEYVTHGWTGDPLENGAPTPPFHDGMAVVRADGTRLWLIRNHERRRGRRQFADPALVWDARAPGGTTTLVFDTAAGRWVGPARASLGGTSGNCSGGVTPWGTWLSCEESLDVRLEPHGWVFEVAPEGAARPEPLTAMGRFNHEAAAVDPRSGIVYQTEDRPFAGFYRFVPAVPGVLRRGGRLEMLAVPDRPRALLDRGLRTGATFPTTWVAIDDPERGDSPGTRNGMGVFMQGRERGGAAFVRLEGCWWGHDRVWFTSTLGGDAGAGQVWTYEPDRARLALAYESPTPRTLDSPDQGSVGPRGGVVMCEDGNVTGQRLVGLTSRGAPFALAESNVVLHGERNGLAGDFRSD